MRGKYGRLYYGVVVVSLLFVGAAANAATSIKKGVYSAPQAKVGERVYSLECARCHLPTLLGGEKDALPLIGKPFLERWEQSTLDTLYSRMRDTMPSENPGKLTEAEYINVLAFILQKNKFPAGPRALSPDLSALSLIIVDP